jgi:transposase InsO family protein
VRATKPNEIWHIDVTLLKLLDGTKAYIHAVIDNYSRKILAWTVAARLDPATTCAVLVAAGRHLKRPGAEAQAAEPKTTTPRTTVPSADAPLVYSDAGVENVNDVVAATVMAEGLRLVLAQVEVTFSNSLIEAFWKSLKHGWLYLNPLDSVEQIRKLVAFFVEQHNTMTPHSAFHGQTPDEMYFGTAKNLEDELAAARKKARQRRFEVNRSVSCHRCKPATGPPAPVTIAGTHP